MRLSTYNVENLFARAMAMQTPGGQDGVLTAHARVNRIIAEPTYSDEDKALILELLDDLGLQHVDEAPFARLRQNRGRLVRRRAGVTTVTAVGRADWIGWVDLVTGPCDEASTRHLAMVIRDVAADVQAVVEAESRGTLKDFSDRMLPAVGGTPFDQVRLFTGNDLRGINVGVMTRSPYGVASMQSHADDADELGRIFSRDCAVFQVATPAGGPLVVLVNHLKSRGYGHQADNDAVRRRQAARVADIYRRLREEHTDRVAVVGDFNDAPSSPALAPLLTGTDLRDIAAHPAYTRDGRDGTYGDATARLKIDYILLSPALFDAVTGGGTVRSGAWGGTRGTLWPHYPTLTDPQQAASDHCALFADIDI